MNLKSMVEIGGKIEINLERDHLKDLKGFSMVQDVTHGDELIITLPMIEGRPILLNPMDRVKIFFFQEEGCYCFHGKILNRFKMRNVDVIGVQQTSIIKKIQRREFYRLKTVLPIRFRIIEEGDEPLFKEGYCLDISGSGLRLNTDHKLDVDTLIECSITLNSSQHVLVKGKVVRVNLADNLAFKYELGISYQDLPDNTRDTLVKFIFKKQRELRKKGFI